MYGAMKRAVLCLLAVMLAFSAAAAETAPAIASFLSAPALQMKVTGRLLSLPGAAEGALESLNAGLDGLTVSLSGWEDGEGLAAFYQGERIFAAQILKETQGTRTSFFPSGRVYITDPEAKDALTLLAGEKTGGEMRLPLRGYADAAAVLFKPYETQKAPKTEKRSTAIKNAGTAAYEQEYLFTGEEMNALWPALSETLNLPGVSLEFDGEYRVKRFLDKEMRDLGLQVTGKALDAGESRKLTLFFGIAAGKGAYFSLALSALRGKNDLKITYSEKKTEKKSGITWEATYTREEMRDRVSEKDQVKASLQAKTGEESEAYTGEITVEKTRGKEKTVLTITPQLSLTADEMTGTVRLAQKKGPEAELRIRLFAGESDPADPETEIIDLRGLTEQESLEKVTPEMQMLLLPLARWIAALPGEGRNAVLHTLRTEAWMQEGSVPVPEGELLETDDWILEEEAE